MRLYIIVTCAFIAQIIAQAAIADDNFHGIIESRPDGKAGTWVVGGRTLNVTVNTDLREEHLPLRVGACAEVEIEDGLVEEIESESPRDCAW
ncbi:MAG: hypothetical protein ABFR19_06360 [Pseudomonadota bacterium]